jgi:hypothetical protein
MLMALVPTLQSRDHQNKVAVLEEIKTKHMCSVHGDTRICWRDGERHILLDHAQGLAWADAVVRRLSSHLDELKTNPT